MRVKTDAEILDSVRSVIADLHWVIRCEEELMNTGGEPVDIERERIDLRNWKCIERWLEHRIKMSHERR